MPSFKELTRKVSIEDLDDESSIAYVKEKYARRERSFSLTATHVHVANKDDSREESQYWDWLFSIEETEQGEEVCVQDS